MYYTYSDTHNIPHLYTPLELVLILIEYFNTQKSKHTSSNALEIFMKALRVFVEQLILVIFIFYFYQRIEEGIRRSS